MSKKDVAHEPENLEKDTEETAKKCKKKEAAQAEDLQAQVEELQAKLEEAAKKQEETKDQLLRTLAEYDNYRKRTEREKAATYDNAAKDTVAEFLNIVDTMEMALAQKDCSAEDLRKGVEMIGKNLQDVLAKLGVTAIGEVGDPFDPEIHQAVSHVEDDALGENVISMVYRKGYRIGDRIVRHATVVVAN
ncbi:MAG: nucleotide exchange factor GrpE [Clostridiales bacterium]|nr:nucleotide exchange factor GrpE [Clostridiales bacterium]